MSLPSPTAAQRLAERLRPPGNAVMRQRWEHLLFLHWEWDPEEIQRTLPPGLTVDTFGGRAFIGLVPFFMNNIRPTALPPVPWISYFLEMNVRTYVSDRRGRPGVWFYSLDCNRPPAVWIARAFFHLPYEHAWMKSRVRGGEVAYESRRLGDGRPARFEYAAAGPPESAEPGSLEFFLAERYRLFAHRRRDGRILSGQVHHTPYPLSPANVKAWDARPLILDGFPDPGRAPDHAHYSRGVAVEVFAIEGKGA